MTQQPIKQVDVVTRYGVNYCRICNLAIMYCKGHATNDAPAPDGAESDLRRRIREARHGR